MTRAEIYKLVKENIAGWMVEAKLEWFEKILLELSKLNHKIIIVELGVFEGMSAIALGLLIKEFGINGKVYAVDAWEAAATAEGSNSPENTEWWAKQDFADIYNKFQRHIINFELKGIVIPIKGKSLDVAKDLPNNIDLLHCDGNHAYEVVVEEIRTYAPKVKGYWILDDERWREMKDANSLLYDFDFTNVHSYNEDGQSFGVYHWLYNHSLQ